MTLAEKIALLANPAPVFQDPEDIEDETAARLTTKDDVKEVIDPSSTKLRRKVAPLLEDEDRRYAGKAVSRKSLTQFSDDDESSDSDDNLSAGEHSDDSEDEESDDESEDDLKAFQEKLQEKATSAAKIHKIKDRSKDEEHDSDGEIENEENESDEEMEDEENETESDEEMVDEENETESDEKNYVESDEEIDLESFKQQLVTQAKLGTTQFTFEDDGDYSKYAGESESESGDTDDENESGDTDGQSETESGASEVHDESKQKNELSDEDDTQKVLGFSSGAMREEVAKGEAARTQLNVWDSLLEGRIRLQKSLALVNQLPQPDTCHLFMAKGGQPLRSALSDSRSKMKRLLDKLVELQSLLFVQNPQTRYIMDGKSCTSNTFKQEDSDDEEITSEEEDGGTKVAKDEEEEKEETVEKLKQSTKRTHAFGDYPGFLAKRHKAFNSFRDATIQKWYEKIRVGSGKVNKGFSAFERSTLKQIKQILGDRNRLIGRTRIKRTAYDVLGKAVSKSGNETRQETNEGDTDQNAALRGSDVIKEEDNYDAEIFDDSDFYHQILREVIERKTANVKDPVELSRQWLRMQSMRKKARRKVDSRATKGRKIRYNIHPKLVNFMAPDESCEWTEESRTDLFDSLFGKNSKKESKTEHSTETG